VRLIDGYAHTEQCGGDTKALDPPRHDRRAPKTFLLLARPSSLKRSAFAS
jgi:hypothetical protein